MGVVSPVTVAPVTGVDGAKAIERLLDALVSLERSREDRGKVKEFANSV